MERISKKLEASFNEQINRENDNARFYLAISQWLSYEGWAGAAKLFKKYSDEEMGHMDKFYDYVQDRDCNPLTKSLPAQPDKFSGIEDVVAKLYAREIKTTEDIKAIAIEACDEKDLTAYDFLLGMLKEQREEEAKALYWVDRLEMLKGTGSPLIFLDNEMGT
jgi:ferritin